MKKTQPTSFMRTRIILCLMICLALVENVHAGFAPPPLRLVSFNARNVENAVMLEWRTVGENNTDYFSIEQSTDGTNFKKVGTMKAAGIDPLNRYYSYSDVRPATGNNYYRLSMYDLDGTVKYSAKQVIKTEGLRRLHIFPNPVINAAKISVSWNSSAGNASINIYELNGKLAFRGKLGVSGKAEVVVQNWPTGVYNLILDNGIRREVSKLIISN